MTTPVSTDMTLEAEATMGRGLPVRRWRLGNGLGVISVVDRTAPVVAFQTWYRVGSRHERPGRTGMAHFFEHLMFHRTETLGQGEFDRVVEGTGGESNAATWVDWTYYRLSVPARELPLAVRLESERMRRVVLDPAPVEAERDVVSNERRERVEDDVDGWLDEQLMANAFSVHPYHWPTIGWMADIRAVPLAEIIDFYRTWYSPNNATLVVVGDFDEQALLELVAAAYGAIPPATLPGDSAAIEPAQTAERVIRAKKPIATDRILIGYRAPGQGDADWATLELVATLLTGSPSSRLYRRLMVENELASSVDVQLLPFRDPSLLRVSVTVARGHTADEVLGEIDKVIAELCAAPPPSAELAKIKNLVETDFWASLVDGDGKAEALGHHETALGDFRTLFTLADRLGQVTGDDLHACAGRYLRRDSRTIIIAEPSGAGADADADAEQADGD